VLACSAANADGRKPVRANVPAALAPPAPVPFESLPLALDLPEVAQVPGALSEQDLRMHLEDDPAPLGSMSVGRPNRGALFNGVLMPESPIWHVVDPKRAYGTAETIGSLMTAIARVDSELPGGQVLYVGHLSSARGGYLRPHRSHQSGRDVDLGYYYVNGAKWYARASAKNLDLPRTWALVKALADDPNLENVFMDRSVQRLLYDHALGAGEPTDRLDALFQRKPKEEKVVRHEWGHLTHMHVRFRSEVAQDNGARSKNALVAMRAIPNRRY
jgi:murein endopeptidase